MLKLIAPVAKKQSALTVPEETDSESENVPATATSTPIKTKITATNHKTTPVNSRNTRDSIFLTCVERRSSSRRQNFATGRFQQNCDVFVKYKLL